MLLRAGFETISLAEKELQTVLKNKEMEKL